MHGVDPFHQRPLIFSRLQAIVSVDAFDHQHASLEFDFSRDFRTQFAATGIDSARFQRAPEGSGQSATRSGHHVVERRGAGRIGVGRYVVVRRHF